MQQGFPDLDKDQMQHLVSSIKLPNRPTVFTDLNKSLVIVQESEGPGWFTDISSIQSVKIYNDQDDGHTYYSMRTTDSRKNTYSEIRARSDGKIFLATKDSPTSDKEKIVDVTEGLDAIGTTALTIKKRVENYAADGQITRPTHDFPMQNNDQQAIKDLIDTAQHGLPKNVSAKASPASRSPIPSK